jgi:hypothetical protein
VSRKWATCDTCTMLCSVLFLWQYTLKWTGRNRQNASKKQVPGSARDLQTDWMTQFQLIWQCHSSIHFNQPQAVFIGLGEFTSYCGRSTFFRVGKENSPRNLSQAVSVQSSPVYILLSLTTFSDLLAALTDYHEFKMINHGDKGKTRR